MTPEEQRIALAEWAGWKRYITPLHDADGLVTEKRTMVRWTAPGETFQKNPYWSRQECPDYLNDLNAVHLLEKKLPDGHTYWKFIGHLDNIVKRDTLPFIADRANATAAQRCEALLKTLNLWNP